MKLKMSGVRDKGILDKERVVFNVLSAVDVGRHMLAKVKLNSENKLSNKILETFWFPDKEVNIGDFVIVYTKKGSSSSSDFKNVKSHFFYLGKSECIWNESNIAAVLFETPNWESVILP